MATTDRMTLAELREKAAGFDPPVDVSGCTTKEEVHQAIVRELSERLMERDAPATDDATPSLYQTLAVQVGTELDIAAREGLTIHQAIGAVKRAVRAVAKDRSASDSQGGYKFRGIEAVLGAVHAPMAAAGVFMVPRDLEFVTEPWTHYSSDAWHMTKVHVEWTIFGPAGDEIVTSNWGEALDNADKGLGKARSYAQKDLLIRLLELPTGDDDVGDTEGSELESPLPRGRRQREPEVDAVPAEEVHELVDRLATVIRSVGGGKHPDLWRDSGLPNLKTLRETVEGKWALTRAQAERADAVLAKLEADAAQADLSSEDVDRIAAGASTPCVVCGSTRTKRVIVQGDVRCELVNACRERAEAAAAAEEAEPPPAEPTACAECGAPAGDPHQPECSMRPFADDGEVY